MLGLVYVGTDVCWEWYMLRGCVGCGEDVCAVECVQVLSGCECMYFERRLCGFWRECAGVTDEYSCL